MDESTARSCHPDGMRQAFLWALLPTLMLVLNVPDTTYGQIVTNITPTTTAPLDLGTELDQVGSTTQITGGTRPGNGTNLFHSFDLFTLGTRDTAHFLNDMQLPTNNIFGRVIGGEASTIDGTLQTNNPLDAADSMNFGAAHLWLVNPSGLLLGPNARIEVGGSVSMSTANYLRFEFEGTSTLFDMLSSPASLGQLSVAPVVAFGFVGSNPGDITVQGSQFSVTDGQSISLVGGNVSIESATPEGGATQPAQLLAPNGKIQLASAASTGEFDAATLQALPNADSISFTSFGSVSLAPGSSIDVHGTSTVFIKGGQFVLSVNDATLNTSENSSETPAPRDTVLLRQGSSISTSNAGMDPGAEVQIIASDVHLVDGSLIITQTSGSGRGGDVRLTADSLTLENRSQIFTTNSGLGLVGGDLFLNVGTLNLLGGESGGSLIGSINSTGVDLDEDGVVDVTGVGGNINITVQGTTQGGDSGSMVLAGGSGITSDAREGGGNGGGISIRATSLDLGEATIIKSSTTGTGHGGDIVVEVQRLRVVDDATISSSTSSENLIPAAGGTVTVQGLAGSGSMASSVLLSGLNTGIVSDSVKGLSGNVTVNAETLTITDGAVISIGSALSGLTGLVTVTADSVLISAGGRISSQSFAEDAGNVTITADELTLDKGSIVTSTSSESGGRGGDVVLDVRTGTVSLTNGASINSQSGSQESPFSTGRAGDITITSESLTLANQSEITSSSQGTVPNAGDAGNVTVTSSGAFKSNASTIATSAENARGGNIDVTAQSVTLSDGTVVSASSRSPLLPDGEGNAGNITVRSGSTFVMQNSSMTTEARFASGGQITIITPEMIRVINGQVSTSVAGSEADTAGGNITIDPQFVVLQNGQIIAQAVAGEGGDINIIAGAFLADPSSLVSASSQRGISGVVNIQAQVQNLGEQLTPLSEEFSSAAALLAQQCAARVVDGKFSTFVVAGREGLPVEPGGYLASPSLTAELLGSHLSGRHPHPPTAAVTGVFPAHDARPIQLAKLGNACRH